MMNKMNPDNDLALQSGEAVPDALRGTRQGLFYLLSRSPARSPYVLAEHAEAESRKEVVTAPQVSQPVAPRATTVLAQDDFKFNF